MSNRLGAGYAHTSRPQSHTCPRGHVFNVATNTTRKSQALTGPSRAVRLHVRPGRTAITRARAPDKSESDLVKLER